MVSVLPIIDFNVSCMDQNYKNMRRYSYERMKLYLKEIGHMKFGLKAKQEI